jgi:Protein of unknown function (DUF1091)
MDSLEKKYPRKFVFQQISFLDIEDFEYNFNPVYSNVTSELKKDRNNITFHNLNIEFFKNMAKKVIVKLTLILFLSRSTLVHNFYFQLSCTLEFMEKDGSYKTLQKLIKIDICEVLGNGKVIRNPLLNAIFSMIRSFGRIPMSCPIKKVQTRMENFKF